MARSGEPPTRSPMAYVGLWHLARQTRLSTRLSTLSGMWSDATTTHAIVAGRVGLVTFAEIGEALASVDVSGRDPEWRSDWAELIATVRRAPGN